MFQGERRDAGDVALASTPSFAGELANRCRDVGQVLEGGGVEGQRADAGRFLVFLAVVLPDLTPIATPTSET